MWKHKLTWIHVDIQYAFSIILFLLQASMAAVDDNITCNFKMRTRIMVLRFFAWSPVWVSAFHAWPYETKQSQLGSCLGFLCCLDAHRSSVSDFIVCKSSSHSKQRIESVTVFRSGVSAHSKASVFPLCFCLSLVRARPAC